MGANQQTSVPAFTAGQVLTAQQQTEINTGIPVFADSTARTAAFGGTGEKVLAEGQYSYLEDTNSTQVYDGSSWVVVGASGLTYITGAAFTTATSVSLPNDTFTSAYRNYRFIMQLTALTADATFTMRLRTSGTDNTTTNYRTAGYGTSSVSGLTSMVGNAQSSFNMAESDSGIVAYSLVLDLISPQIAIETTAHGRLTYFAASPNGVVGIGFGLDFNATTQFDSLSFISNIASSMTGIYRVYGYADS